MKYLYQNSSFAAAYGTCAYGEGSYQGSTTCSTSGGSTGTGTSSSQNGGLLVNTGLAVSAIMVLVSLIVLTSLVVRFWRRGKNKPSSPSVE